MIPDKIMWLLGYNHLAMIIEQERKHWLLKTDRQKQVQDRATGNLFKGTLDNIGTDVVMEAEKMEESNANISQIVFADPAANNTFAADYSAFNYSAAVNGLMISRITSINYQYSSGGNIYHSTYKLVFRNVEKVTIPLSANSDSDDVYATRWIVTDTNPTVLIADSNGMYTISKELRFANNVTNVKFYYPLTEAIQPLNLTDNGDGSYTTEAVVKDAFIGYPMFWFTCDQSMIGPTLTFQNNDIQKGKLLAIGNVGNASKYESEIYTNFDGDGHGTPDNESTSTWYVLVSPKNQNFTNTSGDFSISLGTNITFLSSLGTSFVVTIQYDNDNVTSITMHQNENWEYVDSSTYKIQMSVFDNNCSTYALQALLDVKFNENIPFTNLNTYELGYAGVRMGVSKISSDIYEDYPHGLNKWDGLPEWLNDPEHYPTSPQHLAAFAIHNSPLYDPDIPDSRQVAAVLLDPGTTDDNVETSVGRAYIISNDKAEYVNNETATYPKPARTAARICDIPTSIAQLTNIQGISPTAVVDPKYVRSQASYTLDDKNRIYNVLPSRWVRPTALGENGYPVVQVFTDQNNDKFVFQSVTLLNKVDLVNHNEFRYKVNLCPMVNTSDVSISNISDPGADYAINDVGLIVVGGVPFEYLVTEVNGAGGVVGVTLTEGSSNITQVALDNFDIIDGSHGVTSLYGTSPTGSSHGTGLKVRLMIANYDNIAMQDGEIFTDLFAFVRDQDGIALYEYDIVSRSSAFPKLGEWKRKTIVSPFENSSYNMSEGHVSISDSLMATFIPRLQELTIASAEVNDEAKVLKVYHSPSFVNVLDENKTPVDMSQTITGNDNYEKTYVDFNRFYCDGFKSLTATEKSTQGVINALKNAGEVYFDTYIAWKWDYPGNRTNLVFKYAHIKRGFINQMSSDTTSILPKNDLNTNKYVHSNVNTTIVWDVDQVGPMMWTFNPIYTMHEKYVMDPETRDIRINKKELSWATIVIYDISTRTNFYLANSGRFSYNILSNNPYQLNADTSEVFYQQPEIQEIATVNTPVSTCQYPPIGNWELVFPRINNFTIDNIKDGRSFTPVKLQMIRGDNIDSADIIRDEFGHIVNHKTLLVSDNDSNINLSLYNTENGRWEKI